MMNDDPWGTGWGGASGQTSDARPVSAGKGDGARRGCFNCGEDGHSKADCPNPPKPRGCFNCGEEGHSKMDCPNPLKPRGCFSCGEEGHSKADCPTKGDGNRGQGAPRGCFRCGKEGHSKADCPEPELCRNCGGEGHSSRDCDQQAVTRTVKDKDGNPVELYVPVETSDEQLYAQGIKAGVNFDNFDQSLVQTDGDNVPSPANTFEEMNLRQFLKDVVIKCGFSRPTPIQKYAIPCATNKRDLIACAQTGSGKTAAFLLPIINDLLQSGCSASSGPVQTPEAVILAPTRELAIQIKDVARMFTIGSVLRVVVVYGGTSTEAQSRTLCGGCNILIATPGRLKDFVNRSKVLMENVKYFVMDEADRLLDLGFSEVIREIGSSMPPRGKRVTLMFSATFPAEVKTLSNEFLENPVTITIGLVGGANNDVIQTIFEVKKAEKREKLVEILRDLGAVRTMIFVEQKKNCDFIATYICMKGFDATSIHGDRLQRERETALSEFRKGIRSVLVATNVAARGLDISGVEQVINYDLPASIDEYVHRIGRTGRVGNVGKAVSFFDPSDARDMGIAPELVNVLAACQQEVPAFLQGGSGGNSGFVNTSAAPDSDDVW